MKSRNKKSDPDEILEDTPATDLRHLWILFAAVVASMSWVLIMGYWLSKQVPVSPGCVPYRLFEERLTPPVKPTPDYKLTCQYCE